MTTLWVDVEDLLEYALAFRRPSGVQRLAFELYAALAEEFPDQVRFVRQDRGRGGFVAIGWDEVTARFARVATPTPVPSPTPARRRGEWLRRRLERLPAEVRVPLKAGLRAQAGAVANFAETLRAALRRPDRRQAEAPGGTTLAARARPGDVLAAFGAPWFQDSHPAMLATARDRLGLRVALLIYDLIPLRRPEWCEPAMAARFATWFHAALPLADIVFAISRATAGDVEAEAGRTGIALAGPVRVVPVGSGFTPPDRPVAGLPAPGSYVLFVSTLEVRKNHLLAVRAWRRLLEELPAERVPQLVFAGRPGYLSGDLRTELANSRFLGGKVALFEQPDDAELAALYRGCRFTLFPSLYEGWGLPVTESLAFGKPCLAAASTSLPEAGSHLARYFDPESVTDAVRAVRAILDDPAGLAAWEAEVRAEFRPVPWQATARAIVEGLAVADATEAVDE